MKRNLEDVFVTEGVYLEKLWEKPSKQFFELKAV